MKGLLLPLYQDLLGNDRAGFMCECLTSVISFLHFYPISKHTCRYKAPQSLPYRKLFHYRILDTHSIIEECPVIFITEVTSIEVNP